MAKFQVMEIFRLPKRAQFVIAGRVTVGEVRAGMNALVLLDSRLYWRIQIAAVEFIDRVASKESLRSQLELRACDPNATNRSETATRRIERCSVSSCFYRF